MKGILVGSSSLKEFPALTGETITERESKRFEKGHDAKVKIFLYRTFGKDIEFINYLHGVPDAGSRLFISFSRELIGLLRNWVGIEVERVIKKVCCMFWLIR